jgi:hypothetical protein
MSRWQIRFSLATPLLLAAVVAVLLATGRRGVPDFGQPRDLPGLLLWWEGEEWAWNYPRWDPVLGIPDAAADTIATRLVLGAAVGLGTGIWYGLRQRRRLRGLLIGIPVAIVVGRTAALFLAHGSRLPMAAVGSLVLIVAALVLRWLSIPPPADE